MNHPEIEMPSQWTGKATGGLVRMPGLPGRHRVLVCFGCGGYAAEALHISCNERSLRAAGDKHLARRALNPWLCATPLQAMAADRAGDVAADSNV